ncbi:hypothetical protein BO94DRAFT_196481 [Aspergillus sclerotioniger CBS 115572]|uniref:P-loop containing nucleoside triphosphate hydrolase protein n=1 Tax=Aspergillus sclerotioniger CBS 115572 TaxID=1450535 RepID=A0A317VSK2_9EURO|nr:hypothetical protein BO94DRAFT_196481 [Aspergillus sclerotioniger CBS 115572]PWY77303.1 hypothetical protein BO94DRAFT_196481 [Aspergillus sclerotioniger CBS 115572]
MTMNGHPSPRRLLLVSVPRTASNLLLKILNIPDQPHTVTTDRGGYFFYDAFVKAVKDGRLTQCPSDWTDDAKTDVQSAFQECFDHLEESCNLAEGEGNTMFAKEHAFWFFNPMASTQAIYGDDKGPYDFSSFRVQVPDAYGSTRTFSPNNQTVFPDEYLRTWTMLFIIRHPAIVFPSFCRAMTKVSKIGVTNDAIDLGTLATNMTLRWTRILFDWCVEQTGSAPLLLDAHDVIHNPGAVAKFCRLAGLDPNKLKFEWEKTAQADSGSDDSAAQNSVPQQRDNWDAAKSIMLSTLQGSSGVMKDKQPGVIDIATESKKWRAEFGEEMAMIVEKAVNDAMPDYEYLKANRVTV